MLRHIRAGSALSRTMRPTVIVPAVCTSCGSRRLASAESSAAAQKRAAALQEHSKATHSRAGHSHAGHDHAGHDHAHGGIFHSHVHDPSEGAGQLMDAFKKGRVDRGSRITLIGLASNIGLTASKGLAGFYMNSASLLAEAGHSLSDLLGDFVTLASWKVSRKPPSDTFPIGYLKFETLGSLSVSIILVGGAIGIGMHSYHLLLQTLLPYLSSLPADSLFSGLGAYLPPGVPSPLLELFHSHGPSALPHEHGGEVHDHAHSAILNPHAAWFAAGSVIVKEALYRATKKVAVDENSPVLEANALHHRADAATSLVALFSILGSSLGGYTFLDPLGGLAVSFFILQQGLGLSKIAMFELLDRGIDQKIVNKIEQVVAGLVDGNRLIAVRNVRGVKSGGQTLLDLTIVVPSSMSVHDSHSIEVDVREAVMRARKEVREVRVHVHGLEPGQDVPVSSQPDRIVRNDFGRDGC